jgi:alkanesulfonate monooxygenase SsuD/methylene tetrahydromethanopterin reductase-like flavin-dependent oxidoreductase (luciferase family)
MQFGIRLMQNPTDVKEILARAQLADELRFDSVWLPDHLLWPRDIDPPHACIETWTAMTAVGATTKHVRLGFAMLNPSFRQPAHLAKMVTTLDQITDGRVIFSIGAGWLKSEYTGYGLPFIDDPEVRAGYEREVVQLCMKLWTEPSPVNFEGEHVQLRDCWFYPPPVQQPHPPIWFGGNSDRTRSLVRDFGDGWLSHPQYIQDHLREIKFLPDWPTRPITMATFVNLIVADTREEAIERTNVFTLTPHEKTREELIAWSVLGTPEQCVERLQEMEASGVDYLYLVCDNDESIQRFAREVMPGFETARPAVAAGAAR